MGVMGLENRDSSVCMITSWQTGEGGMRSTSPYLYDDFSGDIHSKPIFIPDEDVTLSELLGPPSIELVNDSPDPDCGIDDNLSLLFPILQDNALETNANQKAGDCLEQNFSIVTEVREIGWLMCARLPLFPLSLMSHRRSRCQCSRSICKSATRATVRLEWLFVLTANDVILSSLLQEDVNVEAHASIASPPVTTHIENTTPILKYALPRRVSLQSRAVASLTRQNSRINRLSTEP
eukprot:759505-Hanusia_phi.AAC.2